MSSPNFPEYDELKDLMTRADAMPWGKTCSELWAKAALLAEQGPDRQKAVQCYLNLTIAYTIGGEVTRCLAPFYWLVREFETNPQVFNGGEEASGVPGHSPVEALGWDYKYALSAAIDLPNVSVNAIEQLFEQMRRLYVSQSDPLNSYYTRKYRFARDLGDFQKAEEYYQKWASTPQRGPFADCEQCEPNYAVQYHCDRQEWQLALEKAQAALNNKHSCDSQPESLYSCMMLPYLYTGDEASAYAMHMRAYRRYQQHPRYLESIPDHLRYLAISGRAGYPGRSQRALAILTRHLPWLYEAETPRTLYNMTMAATLLFDTLLLESADRASQTWPQTLAGDKLAWFKAPHLENPTFAEAREWFYQIASGLAAQYAAREGHPHPEIYAERLASYLAPQSPPAYVSDGSLPDVSGLLPHPKPAGQRQSVPVEGGENVPADGASDAIGDGANVPADEPDRCEPVEAEEDLPALPPVDLTGPWQQMSLRELITTLTSEDSSSNRVYCSKAIEKMCLNDALLEAVVPSAGTPGDNSETQPPSAAAALSQAGLDNLSEREREVFEYCRDYARTLRFGEDSPQMSLDEQCTDPALALLTKSEDHIRNKNYQQAAICANEALYAQTGDPLGVRLSALSLISIASLEAGYPKEGREYARQSVNLSAAAGLWLDQACYMKLLCDCLEAEQRWLELADVAQNALDLLQAHGFTGLVSKDLHMALSTAHLKFEHTAAAAEHLEHALNTFAAANLQTVMKLTQVARKYHMACEFAQSLRVVSRAVGYARELYAADPADDNWKLLTDVIELNTDLLANQPGYVSDTDFELAEELLRELEGLYFDPAHAPYRTKSAEKLDVALALQTAYVYLSSYRYSLGADYAVSAMDKALAAEMYKSYAQAGSFLVRTYISTGQYALADETLTQMEANLSVNFQSKSQLSLVRELRHKLQSRLDEE